MQIHFLYTEKNYKKKFKQKKTFSQPIENLNAYY